MLCKLRWIVLYTVHFTAFSLGGPFLSGYGVDSNQGHGSLCVSILFIRVVCDFRRSIKTVTESIYLLISFNIGIDVLFEYN